MQAVLGNTSRHGVAREAGAEGVGDSRSPVGVGGDGESGLEATASRRWRGKEITRHRWGIFLFFALRNANGYFYVAPADYWPFGEASQNGRSLSAVCLHHVDNWKKKTCNSASELHHNFPIFMP